MSEVELLRSLLKLAVDELRQHNGCYHWSTPEEALVLLERAAGTVLEDELATILETCAHGLRNRGSPRERPGP
ncbi:MAG: hypothetical protein HY815_23435 [Candidatus Riflebacteria bacterium]|nr:hypothetical protein [Candidatus Riflebacteria bacterium]